MLSNTLKKKQKKNALLPASTDAATALPFPALLHQSSISAEILSSIQANEMTVENRTAREVSSDGEKWGKPHWGSVSPYGT